MINEEFIAALEELSKSMSATRDALNQAKAEDLARILEIIGLNHFADMVRKDGLPKEIYLSSPYLPLIQYLKEYTNPIIIHAGNIGVDRVFLPFWPMKEVDLIPINAYAWHEFKYEPRCISRPPNGDYKVL